MRKKKALGQDPLAWIKLTQEREARQKQEATRAKSEPPAPAERPAAAMNWSFLIIYVINMILLLVLVFLVHKDLGERMSAVEGELRALRSRVRAAEQFDVLDQ